MHSLLHYADSIRDVGTLQPVSTAIGERLHITKVKNAYRASNKKKGQFGAQMCTYLNMHEAMDWLARRIAASCGNSFDPRKRTPRSNRDAIVYAKRAHASLSASEIGTIYEVQNFDKLTQTFVLDYIVQQRPLSINPSCPLFVQSLIFDIWHKMTFWTPDLQAFAAKDTQDVAYAHPAHRSTVTGGTIPGCFSPVFVKSGEFAGEGGTNGQYTYYHRISTHSFVCTGLRIGRLRVIFELPRMLCGWLERQGIPPPDKLAYVEWYTNLGRRDRVTNMFKVKRLYEKGINGLPVPAASIIEAADIRRSCFLAPALDTVKIPGHINSDNVLDVWTGEFWVNGRVDHALYRSLLEQ
jgi:hypothetical protein